MSARAVFAACALAAIVIASSAVQAQQFRLPLQSRDVYVTAYFDYGGVQDWSCGDHTYGGHRGTDIGIGGFAVMDAGSVVVVAAADGVVGAVVDGCFDRCTTADCNCGGGFGNHVRVDHADGKKTFYGHLQNGSPAVSVGQAVGCGDVLGRVGSSGFSTGPHLHFEPRVDGAGDDPFTGPCAGPVSYWVDGGAYQDLPSSTCEGAGDPLPPPPPPEGEGEGEGVVVGEGEGEAVVGEGEGEAVVVGEGEGEDGGEGDQGEGGEGGGEGGGGEGGGEGEGEGEGGGALVLPASVSNDDDNAGCAATPFGSVAVLLALLQRRRR